MPHQESKESWLSVTQVLSIAIDKPFLAFWRGKIGNEKASQIQRESQELGIEVHDMIEQRFDGLEIHEQSNACRMVNNFWKEFVGPYQVKAIVKEQTYEDEGLKLQGTFDAVIDCCRGTGITADWKTSNQLDKVVVPLQLAAYDYLRKGSGKGCAVRIDKVKDKVEIHWYEDLQSYWPVYLACLKVARYVKFGKEEIDG